MSTIFRWQIVVDFLVLYVAFYGLLRWARSARALRIALSVVGLYAAALLARHFDLVITAWVFEGGAVLTLVFLLLVFQPELRRAFLRLDAVLLLKHRLSSPAAQESRAIAEALFQLVKERLGALIVVVGRGSIAELMEGGVNLGAAISAQLLLALFQKDSPLHDGAAVIQGNRIVRAGVVLPLTQRSDVPDEYGTRHRAAMGLAERSDSLVLVASEERGEVTLMYGSRIQPIADARHLMEALRRTRGGPPVSLGTRLRHTLLSNLDLKLGALGLAGLIWSVSFLASSNTVRLVRVPVEFSSVPVGLQILDQSADSLEVQIRGSAWIMDSIPIGRLSARFNLAKATPGPHILAFDPGMLDLPPGVAVDRAAPDRVRVHLGPVPAPDKQP